MQLTRLELEYQRLIIFYYSLIIWEKTSNPELIKLVYSHFEKYPGLFALDIEDPYPEYIRVEPQLPKNPEEIHEVFLTYYLSPQKYTPRQNPYHYTYQLGPFRSDPNDLPYEESPYDTD
jgi:hypothetical protein